MPKSDGTHWTVLGPGVRKHHLLCRCVCGTEKEVNEYSLESGVAKSCGCQRGAAIARHGKSKTPEYFVWQTMRARSGMRGHNAGHPRYAPRGIKVCERWNADFSAFLADMGTRPTAKHMLDRIDNDAGYWCGKRACPECSAAGRKPNCRWATRRESDRNKENNRLVTYKEVTKCLVDWAPEVGISVSLLHYRIFEANWPVAEAMETKPNTGKPVPLIEYDGRAQTVQEWAKETGLSVSLIKHRVFVAEWPVEQALTQKPDRHARRRKIPPSDAP